MTTQQFESENKILEYMGSIFIQIFDLISKVGLHNPSEMAVWGISVRTFRYLHCAGNHVYDGYYEVGMTLLRNTYENFLLASYLSKNENEAREWIENKKTFKQKFLREKTNQTNDAYSYFSTYFAHMESFESLGPIMSEFTSGKITLDAYPSYDKKKSETCLLFLIMFNWLTIYILYDTFKEKLNKNDELTNDFKKMAKMVAQYTEQITYNQEK